MGIVFRLPIIVFRVVVCPGIEFVLHDPVFLCLVLIQVMTAVAPLVKVGQLLQGQGR